MLLAPGKYPHLRYYSFFGPEQHPAEWDRTVMNAGFFHTVRLLITGAVFLGACTQKQPEAAWTEDVRLSNGEIVQAQRHHTWTTTHPLGQGVQYLLETASLRIKGKKAETWATAQWTQPVDAMFLDRDERSGEFVLVGTAACRTYVRMGIPSDPMYIEYRYRDSVWRRVALSDFSIGRLSNLLVPVKWAQESGHVSLEEKQRRNAAPTVFAPYRKIDLDALNVCARATPVDVQKQR